MDPFWTLDGLELPPPSSCSYQLIDLSSDKSGRNKITGENYKDIVAQKRKVIPRWNAMPVEVASGLAQKMKMHGATMQLNFFDIAECQMITRTVTTGDFTCDYLAGWTSTRKFVGNISCDFVEK
ncbi:MAG TPA: hypothetical protein VHO94_04025 [Oscillospiraceae bacterium]|nr:hypothetical protein [Oscillospiraceae bacterium]